jgi:Replication initiator protein A
MEEGPKTTKEDRLEGEPGTGLEVPVGTLPSTEFVKVEKNLASLGFFTPSSKRLRNAQEKSFTMTTVADGQRMELKGTIIPSAKYGLPITADQDKWIALCKILTDIIRREGRVTNPVAFTSAEILRLLHKHRHIGKHYREVEEWLDVLFSTTIFSEGVVYLAGEKRRIKDRYRVFERAVSFGKELSDGKVADKHYVWFSDWQIQNINNNHLLPIDLEAYRELKNHIAKALVPLLQMWLYATRREGVYEKRYDELCQFLNIQQYRYESLINRTLGPSLDELKQFGYLADWQIERTSDRDNFKIVFFHGETFHRDRRTREGKKPNAPGAPIAILGQEQHSVSLPRVDH